jgi:hypothetical protein
MQADSLRYVICKLIGFTLRNSLNIHTIHTPYSCPPVFFPPPDMASPASCRAC